MKAGRRNHIFLGCCIVLIATRYSNGMVVALLLYVETALREFLENDSGNKDSAGGTPAVLYGTAHIERRRAALGLSSWTTITKTLVVSQLSLLVTTKLDLLSLYRRSIVMEHDPNATRSTAAASKIVI